MSYIKYCRSCALRAQDQTKCMLTNLPIDPNEDFCSKHTQTIYKCAKCGSMLLQPFLIDGNTYCENCASQANTCNFCKNIQKDCAFQTDPSPTPQYIPQQIRRGNSIFQTNVPNPERIRQFCQGKCDCYDEQNFCMRQLGWCPRYSR